MTNLIGMKWEQLTEEQRNELSLSPIDGETGNAPKKSGECIVDIEGTELSVSGNVEIGEDEDVITIADDAIIYDPTEGVIVDWRGRVKAVRKSAGLTQKQMSNLLHIPIRTIKDWERGLRIPPVWVRDLLVEKLNRM